MVLSLKRLYSIHEFVYPASPEFLLLRGLQQRENETKEGFFIKTTHVSLKILKFNDTSIFY